MPTPPIETLQSEFQRVMAARRYAWEFYAFPWRDALRFGVFIRIRPFAFHSVFLGYHLSYDLVLPAAFIVSMGRHDTTIKKETGGQ